MKKLGERARKYEYSECTELTIYEDMHEVKTAPAVNAVIPVRCKDCKHLMFSDCYGECRIGHMGIVQPDDFCSYGERRADE